MDFAGLWEATKDFANSAFTTSLLGSLAGAAGGALAVERIADRGKRRRYLLVQIRHSNELIEILHGVSNLYLNFKDQIATPTRERYIQQKTAVINHQVAMRRGDIPAGTPLDIGQTDLQTVMPLMAWSDRIEKLGHDNLGLVGRPRVIIGELHRSINALNSSISLRNKWIEDHRASGIDITKRIPELFGLRGPHGHIDDYFGQSIEAMYRQTDDCIFFSTQLIKDVAEHGREMRRAFCANFRGHVARINEPDYSDAIARGLLPPVSYYATWLTGFYKRVRRTDGRRLGKLWYCVRLSWRRRSAWRRRVN